MELIIEDGVKEVIDFAYEGNRDIDRVFIPATVEKIGTAAFKGCVNICDVEFEDGSKSLEIGKSAFEGCESLREIELPGRANRFLRACFKNSGLEILTIGHEGDFIANQDPEKFAGCADEIALNAVIEEERLERVQKLLRHTRNEHHFPVSELLVKLQEKTKDGEDVDTAKLRQLYDRMVADAEFPLEKNSNGYRKACDTFSCVEDWRTIDENAVKSMVSGDWAKCVAEIDRGEIFEREWSLGAIMTMRNICANMAGGDFDERKMKSEFYHCFTRIKHHAAFHRLMAMAHPNEFVQLPAINVLVPLYVWLTKENPPTVEQADWCVLSSGVRSALSKMLPDVDVYKAGVFAWFIADAFRKAPAGNPVNQRARQHASQRMKMLSWMREIGLID